VEPIPETRAALDKLMSEGDTQLGVAILRMARRVEHLVPDCIGLSLALFNHGLTFTLESSTDDAAALDAVQYLDGGPCVASAHEAQDVDVDEARLFDEQRWQMYAQASAAAGVRSSLTLPVLGSGGVAIGTVNMYAATPDAFDGLHDVLAEAVGSTALQAVSNADLSFSTRLVAAEAPNRLGDQSDIDVALGVISEVQRVDLAAARERLRQAAARAGISEGQTARAIRGLFSH
jgi:GAF domain-containing protein